ncbi:MAG TPA: alpha/beta hydrolase [Gammaproteobacteria bacterium]|nr:alpha/beta hydrolase [Gammaproteobacteria bacterium]
MTLTIIVTVVLALLAAGFLFEKLAERADARRYPPLGTRIEVGRQRLHVIRRGPAHGPTVVIVTGAGEPCVLWWPIVERAAEFAGVFAYDRAGLGESGSAPAGRTPLESANELHALLARARIPGPYVLVAHSFGGLIARLFARDHRAEVAGLVLADTLEEGVHFQPEAQRMYRRFTPLVALMTLAARFGVLRLLAKLSRDEPSKLSPEMQARADIVSVSPGFFNGMSAEFGALNAYDPSMRRSGATGDLDNLPLVVITHGQPFPGSFGTLEKYWGAGQERLAALSTRGELVVAHNSNHMIQLDEPDVVVDAIRRVYDAAVRDGVEDRARRASSV